MPSQTVPQISEFPPVQSSQPESTADVPKRGHFFCIENEIIDEAYRLGPFGLQVYCVLKRHSRNWQCFLSRSTIAKKLGISEKSVTRGVNALEKAGRVVVQRRKRQANFYILLPVRKACQPELLERPISPLKSGVEGSISPSNKIKSFNKIKSGDSLPNSQSPNQSVQVQAVEKPLSSLPPLKEKQNPSADFVSEFYRWYLRESGRNSKRCKMSDARKKILLARLKDAMEMTGGDERRAQDLVMDAMWALLQPDHMAENGWLDMEIVLRNRDQFENWLNRYEESDRIAVRPRGTGA